MYLLTLDHNVYPGTPPSRENDHSILQTNPSIPIYGCTSHIALLHVQEDFKDDSTNCGPSTQTAQGCWKECDVSAQTIHRSTREMTIVDMLTRAQLPDVKKLTASNTPAALNTTGGERCTAYGLKSMQYHLRPAAQYWAMTACRRGGVRLALS